MKQAILINLVLQSACAFAPSNQLHCCSKSSRPSTTTTLQMQEENENGRREFVSKLFGGAASALIASSSFKTEAVNALDMDAFMNNELANDTKNCDPKRDPKCVPELTKDEAMCKYGQNGTLKGEACKRVKASGKEVPKQAQGKTLGGAYAM